MRKNKYFKYGLITLLAVLGVIILCIGAYAASIYSLNNVENSFSVDNSSKDDNCRFSVYDRGGATDSWMKNVQVNGKQESWNGKIFDAKISNLSHYSMAQWSFRLNIKNYCYLNNAWCGVVEIHQFTDGEEKVQTLDLRNVAADDVVLKHSIEDTDLMIPLNEGDYLIYHPSEEVKEYPISGSENVESEDEYKNSVVGLIFYYAQDSKMDFSDVQVNYRLHIGFTQTPVFIMLVIGIVFWIVLLIIFVVLQISMSVNLKKIQNEQAIIRESIGVFTNIFETKDSYTKGHSQRVAEYTKLIAEKAGFSEEECNHLSYIALMHDIGKFYIPDEILKKPGKLTLEEYEIIKTHPQKGAEMLSEYKSLEGVVDGVLYHHERYDGRGYPKGLAGKDIPMIGRLICVADSFDAMNSKRCYRDTLTKEYILKELEDNKGKQFDPVFVDYLLELINEGKITIG